MRLTCFAQHKGALDGAKNIALSAPRSVGKTRPEGRVVTESDWCCHSVQAEASGK